MPSKTEKLLSLLDGQPVIPVLKIDDVGDAVPLARALARGGLRVIEITLRTDGRAGGDPPRRRRSPGSDRRRRHHPERPPVRRGGRGRLEIHRQPRRDQRARLRRRPTSEVPLLPGAITPGEIMAAREAGLDFLKFFPAEQAGGAAFLKSLASPIRRREVLPDRRRHGRRTPGTISALPNVDLRRRLLGGAGRDGARGQLGRDRDARAGGECAAPVGPRALGSGHRSEECDAETSEQGL